MSAAAGALAWFAVACSKDVSGADGSISIEQAKISGTYRLGGCSYELGSPSGPPCLTYFAASSQNQIDSGSVTFAADSAAIEQWITIENDPCYLQMNHCLISTTSHSILKGPYTLADSGVMIAIPGASYWAINKSGFVESYPGGIFFSFPKHERVGLGWTGPDSLVRLESEQGHYSVYIR
jgi:hypothetical protein